MTENSDSAAGDRTTRLPRHATPGEAGPPRFAQPSPEPSPEQAGQGSASHGRPPSEGSQYGAPHHGSAQYGAPQPGAPQYGPPQQGQPSYGQPQHGQPQYGRPSYGQPQQGQAPYGQPQYGQPQYGQSQQEQPQYGQPSYGQPQYGRPSYGQPQYGQQPQFGAPQYPGPSTPVGPATGGVRPRLLWVVLAWVVALVCVIVGVVGFVGGLVSGIGEAAPGSSFRSGETVTVALDPAESPAVYLTTSQNVNYECRIQGDEQAKLSQTGTSTTVTTGNTTWHLILRISVPKAGQYQLTCATQEAVDDVRFGVGRELAAAAGSLVAGATALVVLPAAGIVLAVVVTVVVLVKRSRARRRLAVPVPDGPAAGAWGPPGAYGG